ncbi:hypothetical protein FG379_001198 [Cryptosporidium bovis]|uniref:uncharacterized protein n=1 Tax=Cryptosporidium bovis TaxID=310047 RepID=UPI00351A1935|nr:hypothetical protein FG379_001198 [Cryptosporidium bovis]
MQVIESKLSAFSRMLKNEDPVNNFILNSGGKKNSCKLVTVVEDNEKNNNIAELDFLISASTLYLDICPSLASRFNCKIANLTDEIRKSKTYNSFFSGRICPKCFSTYIVGKNCKLSIKSLNGIERRKAIKEHKGEFNTSEGGLANNTFKKLCINCYICNYTYSKFFFDKKPKSKKNIVKESKTNTYIDSLINYSNNLLMNKNTDLYNYDCKLGASGKQTTIKANRNDNNIRFFRTNKRQKAANTVTNRNKCTEKKPSVEGNGIVRVLRKEIGSGFIGGEKEKEGGFYDILSRLA